VQYDHKLFGVFPTRNLVADHPITGSLDDLFSCPQSRHAGLEDATMEAAAAEGKIRLLAHNEHTGYTMFETPDHRFVMHLGHPEYHKQRIVEETLRDRAKGRSDVPDPFGFDLENPRNTWRSHRNEFFTAWVKYVYLTTDY